MLKYPLRITNSKTRDEREEASFKALEETFELYGDVYMVSVKDGYYNYYILKPESSRLVKLIPEAVSEETGA